MELNSVLALGLVLMSLLPSAFFYKKYKAAQSQLTIDPLTGVCSRFGFNQIAKRVYDSHQRYNKTSMYLVYFDLDNFKSINDKAGHGFGDEVLASFGRILLENVRSSDVVGRRGGDEFVALLNHPLDTEYFDIEAKMETIRNAYETAVSVLYAVAGKEMPSGISVSYGIAAHEIGNKTSLAELFAKADAKLYKMKGKNKSGR